MFLEILKYFLTIVISYLIGSVSFARIISTNHFKKDITKIGSKNPGTINMTRSHGVMGGLSTFILDILKGAVPSLIAYFIGGTVLLYVAGFSAVIGHIFPALYRFKGGKGLATTIGVFLVANPGCTLIALFIGLIIILATDIGSFASLTIITITSIIECITLDNRHNIPVICLIIAMYALVLFMHRKNIVRLLTGRENKVNLKEHLKIKKKTRNIQDVKVENEQNFESKIESEQNLENENIDNKEN